MLFDTHTHLNDKAFDEDRQQVMQRAQEEGVSLLVNVGFNRETIPPTLQLAETYDFVYAAVGWHPQDASDFTQEHLSWIEELACTHPKVVAIGEMGLDYYWDNAPRDVQKDVFRQQIALAKRVKKPIIIHDRDAHRDVVDILKEEGADQVGGIMHCFGGSVEIAQECLDLGFYISFGGPLTFKNAKKPKEVAKYIPLDRLLIETDSPYLTPHPYRGKRNESSYVKHVAQSMAEIKEVSYEEICRITLENGKRVFGLS
ncbi:TatD family hydrolase [Bacillus horti]|uniref:TatD DNase family protein n=1 Tax=Caldalkalibacillus horti TaxID=77523 RepID=A0ABT9W2V1_9BACI|nr:TatD family hydrolase [Bacillus horti]MDQ0167566.1 TatD DNase family protein [Bacillus horti]